MEYDRIEDAYAYALELTDRCPDALGVGVVSAEHDGQPVVAAVACIVRDPLGRPITGDVLMRVKQSDHLRELAAIKACRTAHSVLAQAIREA